MKRIALFAIGWSVVLPRETQEEDMARVFQILGWLGQEKLFDPTRNGYYVEVEVGSEMFNRLAAIAFDKNLPELRRIVDLRRIDHRYSHEELLSAPLLILSVNNMSIGDDYYDEKEPLGGPCTSHRHCPVCRGNVEQVRDLLVNTRRMSKRGISFTYTRQIILAP